MALVVPLASTPSAIGAARSRRVLPNLVVLPTQSIVTNSIGGACQPIEIVEQGARRCLRFDQIVANEGAGPLELRYEVAGIATDQRLMQRVYRADGTYEDRQASTYVFHAAHAHFHYVGFGQASLWRSDRAGTRLDASALRVGRKAGFCIMDVEQEDPAAAAAHYQETGCKAPDVDGSFVNGISPGWADIYGNLTEGQFIEITGVPDGFYLLDIAVDPDHTLVEKTRKDNKATSLIQICGDFAQLYPPAPGFDFCP
jgi:hypothetical protein